VRNVIALVSIGIAVFALTVASPNRSNAETDIAKAVTDKAEKVISKILRNRYQIVL
jgi:hypothetical protein